MDIQQRIDELEPIAFHNVPVKELAKYCDRSLSVDQT